MYVIEKKKLKYSSVELIQLDDSQNKILVVHIQIQNAQVWSCRIFPVCQRQVLSEKGNNFNLFVFLEGFNSRKHYKGYPLLPNVEKQDNMIVCRSDIESSYQCYIQTFHYKLNSISQDTSRVEQRRKSYSK